MAADSTLRAADAGAASTAYTWDAAAGARDSYASVDPIERQGSRCGYSGLLLESGAVLSGSYVTINKRAPKRVTPHTGHPNAACWSVERLGVFLDCSRSKVLGMINGGDLRAEKVRGQWRIAIAEVKRRFPSLF